MSKTQSPFWYAVGGLFATPLCAILLVLCGALMLVLWPLIPFVMYAKKKTEEVAE